MFAVELGQPLESHALGEVLPHEADGVLAGPAHPRLVGRREIENRGVGLAERAAALQLMPVR